MRIIREERAVVINGTRIEFDQRISELIEVEDKIIIQLYVDDFEFGDPLVGRNVVAYDADGQFLWRIKATGITRGEGADEAPEAWFGLYFDEKGVLRTGTPSGCEYRIDLETGDVSDAIQGK